MTPNFAAVSAVIPYPSGGMPFDDGNSIRLRVTDDEDGLARIADAGLAQ